MNRLASLCVFSFTFIVIQPVFASGFRIPVTSVSGVATSNAVVANHEDPGALTYNPSHMGFHKNDTLVAGVISIRPDIHVTPQIGNETDNIGEDTFYTPGIYYLQTIATDWSWGVGVTSPFGLETEWPSGTFSSFAGPLAPFHPTLSRLELVALNPNVAYKPNPNFSFSFGLNYYDIRELVFDTTAVKITAQGGDFGTTFSFQYVNGPYSFGFAHKSKVPVPVNGVVVTPNFLLDPNQILTLSGRAQVNIPRVTQMGFRAKLTNQLALEINVDRTAWSSFDTIVIETGGPPITSTNNWEDVTAYRLGANYFISQYTTLRFGLSTDPTPQRSENFSARIPDNDRMLYSFGIGHKVDKWSIEAGFMYVDVEERDINSSTPPAPDPNGTSAINGKYESSVSLFALGFTRTF